MRHVKRMIKKINNFIPCKNKIIGVFYFLCISPLLNFILINIYYYNCGGCINDIYDGINLLNPFNIQSPLCVFISTLLSSNIYIIYFINYLLILYIIKCIFY